MPRLTEAQREEIIRRRGTKSDETGKKSRIDRLEIHHKDRDPENNDPRNLRVLTIKEHDDLHSRDRNSSTFKKGYNQPPKEPPINPPITTAPPPRSKKK